MFTARSSTCLMLCLILAGCGGGGDAATPEGETDLGTAENLGQAESLSSDQVTTGAGTETPAADAATLALSPENTQIQFIGTHAGDEPNPRTCEFTDFSGEATLEGNRLTAVSVEIQTNSVKTFDQRLTDHLMSDDFLDMRAHPTIIFETTGIDVGDEGATLNGNLTLMGTTRPVDIPADVSVTDGKLSLTGSLKINRSEYGMDKVLDRVNDEVEINVTVENAG